MRAELRSCENLALSKQLLSGCILRLRNIMWIRVLRMEFDSDIGTVRLTKHLPILLAASFVLLVYIANQ